MKIFICASSESRAMDKFFGQSYYDSFESANQDLKEFGTEYESIFEIDIPIKMVKLSAKKEAKRIHKATKIT